MPRAIGFLLNKVTRRAGAALEHELEPFDLRLAHFMLLMTLARTGPQNQQRLGARLGFDRTTMVALVDHVEGAGYARRDRDPDDRRAYLVGLTDEARALLPKLRSRVAAAEKVVLAPLEPDEREVFRELLFKLATGCGPGESVERD
jgi:DNA-binding MarR family transcriptional regulator